MYEHNQIDWLYDFYGKSKKKGNNMSSIFHLMPVMLEDFKLGQAVMSIGKHWNDREADAALTEFTVKAADKLHLTDAEMSWSSPDIKDKMTCFDVMYYIRSPLLKINEEESYEENEEEWIKEAEEGEFDCIVYTPATNDGEMRQLVLLDPSKQVIAVSRSMKTNNLPVFIFKETEENKQVVGELVRESYRYVFTICNGELDSWHIDGGNLEFIPTRPDSDEEEVYVGRTPDEGYPLKFYQNRIEVAGKTIALVNYLSSLQAGYISLGNLDYGHYKVTVPVHRIFTKDVTTWTDELPDF